MAPSVSHGRHRGAFPQTESQRGPHFMTLLQVPHFYSFNGSKPPTAPSSLRPSDSQQPSLHCPMQSVPSLNQKPFPDAPLSSVPGASSLGSLVTFHMPLSCLQGSLHRQPQACSLSFFETACLARPSGLPCLLFLLCSHFFS